MCRQQGSARMKWDLLIMVLAIWNCIQVPYDIAFAPHRDSHPLEIVANQIIDFIFILDIVITFRTTYINEETGIEVTTSSKIAIQYLKGNEDFI